MYDHLEHQLAEAQSLAHIGSWDWNLVTGKLTWTDEHYRIFGLEPGSALDLDAIMNCVHPADREGVRIQIDRARRDGKPYVAEFRVQHPDGTVRFVEARATIEVDAQGHPLRKHGTAQDVTDRRRADATLRDAEVMYRRRAGQQAAVARFGKAALCDSSLSQLLDSAAALISETLEVEYASVLELCSDGDLLLVSGSGWPDDVVGTVIRRGDNSQADLTLSRQDAVSVEDWRGQNQIVITPYQQKNGVRSSITVIIGAPERRYGVLEAHTASLRSFGEDEVDFLQGIASILAAAIARRRALEMREHLLARAISAQEEERTRVARELHDETGQALSAILVGLRSIDEATTMDRVRQLTERLRDLTSHTIRDVGRIARGLRPSTLDDLGLVPALQRYADDLTADRNVTVTIAGETTERLPRDVETTLYRIVQEALTNVARHAHAKSARVNIERHNGTVRASIRDDGRGFDVGAALHPDARRRALGLVGMQERASLLGGTVTISSRPSGGAQVVVDVPVRGA